MVTSSGSTTVESGGFLEKAHEYGGHMDASGAIETGFRVWYLAMLILGFVSLGLLCQGSAVWRRCRLPAVCLAATIVTLAVLMLAYFGVLFTFPSLSSMPINYCPGEVVGFWSAVLVSCGGIVLGVALLVRRLTSHL
jgi:hypothetical protein